MNTLKLTVEQHDALQSYGKPQGDGRNFTDGVRVVLQMWIDAGRPELPADPCPWGQRNACELRRYVSRYGATFDELRAADGTSAGAGARRLAEWIRQDRGA